MSLPQNANQAHGGRGWLVAGIVLAVLGAAGLVIAIVLPAVSQESRPSQSGLPAFLYTIGALLLAAGIVAIIVSLRVRRVRGGRRGGPIEPEPPDQAVAERDRQQHVVSPAAAPEDPNSSRSSGAADTTGGARP